MRRYGTGRVIFGGFLLAVVAYGPFLPVQGGWSYAAMFPRLTITGVAFALAYGPLTIAATDSMASREQGLADGLLSTFTQFGAAVGISAVTAVYGIAAAGTDGSPDAYRAALIVPVVVVLLGTAVCAPPDPPTTRRSRHSRRARRRRSRVSPATPTAMAQVRYGDVRHCATPTTTPPHRGCPLL
ncbi:MFS transporter [Actinomadura kijaniata]|uniref:MFS transporter n=1 Tax=Actinomadura kijaniata TaxID=46161 RepID=UPI0008323C79|nr:MFS transporter [Actinomadura kijaniata]